MIVGPTASGKSDLAVRLAKKFGGEVVSADSRQVYKGLDIGTGKITKKEMRGVPHHLLDIVNPKRQFSVAEYRTLGLKAVEKILENKKLPIIVGGTGFYIDTLTGTVNFPDVPTNKRLRIKLSRLNNKKLFEMLKKKDLERARTIDVHNKVRLIRALEIVEALGKVPASLSHSHELVHRFVYVGLKPRDLNERIYKRLIKRLPRIIRECRRLNGQGLSYKRMFELGLEYRYVGMFLQGKITKKEAVDKLFMEIKHYAKRQMTWFKRNKKIRWFIPSAVEGFNPSQYKEIEKYAAR